jgi:hypothetical protein
MRRGGSVDQLLYGDGLINGLALEPAKPIRSDLAGVGQNSESSSASRLEYFNTAGEFHRDDGPAVEYADGTKEWWLDGELYPSETDWQTALRYRGLRPRR